MFEAKKVDILLIISRAAGVVHFSVRTSDRSLGVFRPVLAEPIIDHLAVGPSRFFPRIHRSIDDLVDDRLVVDELGCPGFIGSRTISRREPT